MSEEIVHLDQGIGSEPMVDRPELFMPMEEAQRRFDEWMDKLFRKDGDYYKRFTNRMDFLELNKGVKPVYTRKLLERIWQEFIVSHRITMLSKNVQVSMEDILTIGPDKFFAAFGINKPSEVKLWVNNRVRVGKCSHCSMEFIPLMLSANYGLCRKCRPNYSFKALGAMVKTINQNMIEEHVNENETLQKILYLFYHDAAFRSQALKKTPACEEWERAADVYAKLEEESKPLIVEN